MSGRTMAEWKGLGAQILSCDCEHEHVRQQLLRLDAEFAGEVPSFSVPYCRARPDHSSHWHFFMSTQPLPRKVTPSSVSSARWSGKLGARRPAWLTTRWHG